MKKVEYLLTDGTHIELEYDENAPCRACGLPVVSASMGGTDLCPWCDCGKHRNGEPMTLAEFLDINLLRMKAKEIQNKLDALKGVKQNGKVNS